MQKVSKHNSTNSQKQKRPSKTKCSTYQSCRAQSLQRQEHLASAINNFVAQTIRPILNKPRNKSKTQKQMSKTHRSPSEKISIKTISKKKKNNTSLKECDEKLNRYFDNKVQQLIKEKSKANSAKQLNENSTRDQIVSYKQSLPHRATIKYQYQDTSKKISTPSKPDFSSQFTQFQRVQDELKRQLKIETEKSASILQESISEQHRMSEQHAKKTAQLQQRIEDINSQLKQQQQNRQVLERNAKNYMEQIQKFKQNIKQKKIQYDSLRSQYDKLQIQNHQARQVIKENKENVRNLQRKIKRVQCSNFQLEAKLTNQRKEKAHIKIEAQGILSMLRQEFPQMMNSSHPFGKN